MIAEQRAEAAGVKQHGRGEGGVETQWIPGEDLNEAFFPFLALRVVFQKRPLM